MARRLRKRRTALLNMRSKSHTRRLDLSPWYTLDRVLEDRGYSIAKTMHHRNRLGGAARLEKAPHNSRLERRSSHRSRLDGRRVCDRIQVAVEGWVKRVEVGSGLHLIGRDVGHAATASKGGDGCRRTLYTPFSLTQRSVTGFS